jgi:hypothetical protein
LALFFFAAEFSMPSIALVPAVDHLDLLVYSKLA